MQGFRRTLLPILLLFAIVISFGTTGYYLIERWSLLDAFYMTAITLTTVGFSEVQPLSNNGRLFTIALIFLGAGSIFYGISSIGEYLLTADIGPFLRQRQSKRMIKRMNGHVVVCGYGRVGKNAVSSLMESKREVVVIDKDEKVVEEMRGQGLAAIHGDATDDDVLKRAGIERAGGLIVCGGSDADNLYVVLSARALNASLTIVSRSVDPASEEKMLRAGANRVISPYQLGGRYMANVLTRPGVIDFFQLVTLDSGLELWLEEIQISNDSPLAGLTVIEADLRRKTGVTLVGLIRRTTNETLTPNETTRLEANDILIALGTREQLSHLNEMASNQAAI